MLPPRPVPLESQFEKYGVSPKQKDKARQAFERSAQQAGFFEHGRDRLVMPSGAIAAYAPAGREEPRIYSSGREAGSSASDPEIAELDPLIRGLLKRMPPASQGWQVSDRARWLQTLAMNLSFIYEDAIDEEAIEVIVRKGRDGYNASDDSRR